MIVSCLNDLFLNSVFFLKLTQFTDVFIMSLFTDRQCSLLPFHVLPSILGRSSTDRILALNLRPHNAIKSVPMSQVSRGRIIQRSTKFACVARESRLHLAPWALTICSCTHVILSPPPPPSLTHHHPFFTSPCVQLYLALCLSSKVRCRDRFHQERVRGLTIT